MSSEDSRAQWEEERLLSFPGKDSAYEKPWMDSLVTTALPASFSPL